MITLEHTPKQMKLMLKIVHLSLFPNCKKVSQKVETFPTGWMWKVKYVHVGEHECQKNYGKVVAQEQVGYAGSKRYSGGVQFCQWS